MKNKLGKGLSAVTKECDVSECLTPYTLRWFRNNYRDFTPAQKMAIPAIKKGNNVLISSPTGTGKTLAAFLAIIDELVSMGIKGLLDEKVYAVYVSPLRALDNDMRRNLIPPLKGIREVVIDEGIEMPEVKAMVRTGDTTQSERAKMLRHPPHILITTPESLALLITAPKFRLKLKNVRWVIIDEIHELASSKRGAHLSLTLERLEELVDGKIQRIGLSATIYPLEKIAQYLVGLKDDGVFRDYLIVDARFVKPMKIKVLSPKVDIVRGSAEEINEAIYRLLKKIIFKHKTTLIFTNTRSATERVVYKLKKILESEGIADVDEIEAHHSSLSRDVRLDVERKLKKGLLKAVVCVDPETLIYTDKGPKPISQLSKGDKLLSLKGDKLVYADFRGLQEIDYFRLGIELRTEEGLVLKATREHKVLAKVEDQLRWVEVKDLRKGQTIITVKEKEGNYVVLTDRIRGLRETFIQKAYGIIDSGTGNFITNGIISKNSSSSLELGIDIGYIDAVVLLSSPKSVTRLIQRVGRSGHGVNDISKGYVVAVDRDDLVEDTVLAYLAIKRKLDRVRIPMKPLDILAQHIVGMSLEHKWRIQDAYKVVRRAYNFKDLTFEEFMNVLRYLAGRYGSYTEGLPVYSKIWMDELEGVFGRKRSARVIYYLNSGAIPDEAKIRVLLNGRKYVGDLEEGFVEYLEPGDIFVLGGKTYRYVRSSGTKIIVESAEGLRPTVPSWYSEMLPLTYDSAIEVGKFRNIVKELISKYGIDGAVVKLYRKYRVSKLVAENIVRYVWEQLMYLGSVPSDKEVVIEVWRNPEFGEVNLIFHYLFGRRVNSALSRAYAAVLSDLVTASVRVTLTDNGFMLTLPRYVNVGDELINRLVSKVTKESVRTILRKALRRSEIIRRRFRHVAERSFAILRNYMGRETSVNRRQINSELLFRIAEKIPNYPLVEEAYREVLEDVMDIESAEEVLDRIQNGEIKVRIIKSEGAPSPFSHNIVAQGYSDIVLMEDRRKLLIKLYEAVMKKVKEIPKDGGEG